MFDPMRFTEPYSAYAGTDTHPYQDICGHLGNFAWVFDGATMLRGGERAQTMTVDLVRSYHHSIRAAIEEGESSLRVIMHRAISEAYEKLCDELGDDLPSAAGIICHLEGNQLHYLSFGDTTLIVIHENDLDVVTDSSYWSHETSNMKEAYALGVSHADIVHAHRAKMNTPDGYWIWSVAPIAVRHANSGSISVAPGDEILLASDGLMRLVDLFHIFTHKELVSFINEFGFADTLATLRAAEENDPLCINYPRMQPMDDATGLQLKITE